jgi:hypothetical protein
VTSVVPGTKTAVISNFPPRNEKRPCDGSERGVATRLPIVAAWFEMFEPGKNADPPRGFRLLSLNCRTDAIWSAYSLHLKSNRGSDDPKVFQENIYKREEGITQVLQHLRGELRTDAEIDRRVSWRIVLISLIGTCLQHLGNALLRACRIFS